MTFSTFVEMVDSTEEQRKSFFKLSFGPKARGYICISYLSHTDRNMYNRYYQYPDQLDEMLKSISTHCKQLIHVYFSSVLFKKPNDRHKENISMCPFAWADLDTTNPSVLLVEPSILIQTSPGRFQAVWALEAPLTRDKVEDITQRIFYYHKDDGTDPCWDAGHLLRVPYTPNYKYGDIGTAPVVTIVHAKRAIYRPSDFDNYPVIPSLDFTKQKTIPKLPQEAAEAIIERNSGKFPVDVYDLLRNAPPFDDGEKWSGSLWRLMKMCVEAGLRREETFIVANSAACNKYRRDGRPETELWRDVLRAYVKQMERTRVITSVAATVPDFMTNDEIKMVTEQETFIERYIGWARTLTDAAVQYHQSGAFMILSALLSGNITLLTSFGKIIPNLWFMLLADTAQPLDSPVLTQSGWRKMGDLRIGDQVVGSDGKPTYVIGLNERGVIDNYEVTFMDGSTVECSDDHLWTTKLYTGNYIKTVPLSKIRESLDKGYKPRVPILSNPVEYDKPYNLPIDPYILGLWLAEGSRSKYYVEIASSEEEIAQNIKSVLPEDLDIIKYKGGSLSWHIVTSEHSHRGTNPNRNHVREALKELNLLDKYQQERFIPNSYKFTSVEDRLALLQGVLDGDGSISSDGFIRLSLTCEQLIVDTIEIVKSLGGTATKVECDRKTTAGRLVWQTSIKLPVNLNPFRLKRKANLFKGSTRISWIGIKEVKYLGKAEMRCILVSNSDGLYVTKDFILTHNTITRKSTSMNIAVNLLREVDGDALMATDGSLEGLLVAMRDRPSRPSLFLRDEFTGLLEAIAHKDYMSGFAEQLTKLYDGDSLKRLLRKETIDIRDPVFLMYVGGTKSKTQMLMNEEMIMSGFLPRFIIISAEPDLAGIKPVGPPIQIDLEAREMMKNELIDIHNHYTQQTEVKKGGVRIGYAPNEIMVELTPEAWTRYNNLETMMTKAAIEGGLNHLTPVYDRLSKSTLKCAMLIAASRQREGKVVVELIDLLHAIYYAKDWHTYASEIVNGVGKPYDERLMTKILEKIRLATHGITRSELMTMFMLDSKKADLVFGTLEQRKAIFKVDIGSELRYQSLD